MSEDIYSADYKYNPRTGRKTKAKRIAFNYGDDDKKVEKDEKKEKVEEKMDLSKADMGDVIKDFRSSDAPQFKGKSDKKKREMAIAAKLQADRDMKEEVELEEGVYSSDVERAFPGGKASGVKTHPIAPTIDKKYIKGTPEHKAYKATKKPINGMPTNEEADKKKEDDLPFTPDKPKNPSAKAGKFGIGPSTAKHLAKMGMQLAMKKKAMKEEKDEQEYGYEGAMAITQLKTMIRHADHMMGMMEEDTDLPEWVQSKITLATDYVQTAHDYLMSEMNEELSPKQKKIDKNNNGKIDGQDLAKIRNEETEQIDELSKGTLASYAKKATNNARMQQSVGKDFEKQADKSRKPGMKAAALSLADKYKSKSRSREAGVGKAIDRLAKEDFEQIEERNKENALKRKTMDASRGARFKAQGNHVPAPEPEHKTGQAHNKAIGRAIRQMSNEETEQIDELSKGTLRSYIDKKSDDHESNRNAVADARDALRKHQRNKPSLDAPLKHQFDHDVKKRELEKDVNAASKTATRSNVNILKAKKRLNKEEIEDNEVKISYRDFIKEYESKDGKYVHKGSYGSSYKEPEEDDEPSAKKPSAKKAGRPAGAKSGALQKRQPIKFK